MKQAMYKTWEFLNRDTIKEPWFTVLCCVLGTALTILVVNVAKSVGFYELLVGR